MAEHQRLPPFHGCLERDRQQAKTHLGKSLPCCAAWQSCQIPEAGHFLSPAHFHRDQVFLAIWILIKVSVWLLALILFLGSRQEEDCWASFTVMLTYSWSPYSVSNSYSDQASHWLLLIFISLPGARDSASCLKHTFVTENPVVKDEDIFV